MKYYNSHITTRNGDTRRRHYMHTLQFPMIGSYEGLSYLIDSGYIYKKWADKANKKWAEPRLKVRINHLFFPHGFSIT
jgi:hypothetical protein